MKKIEVRNAVNRVIVTVSMALLCACTTHLPTPVAGATGNSPRTSSVGKPNGNAGNQVEDNAFKGRQVINPNPGIEKDKLHVSYNMKAVHGENGYLLQLTLIFKNQRDKGVILRPRISLLNDKGVRIEAYSKRGFVRSVSRMKGNSVQVTNALLGGNDGSRISTREVMDWADSYWLKDRFSISAQGMEIGELVYHLADINLPMTLIVNADHQEYVFNIKDSFLVYEPQRSDVSAHH